MTLVNLGCGRTIHSEWVNLDVEPHGHGVRRWDVRKALPFPDDSVDMVYHSHLLEHLPSEEGGRLLRECFRILRHGGIVRVAVPDLAGIAGAYLAAREVARAGGGSTMLDWTRMEFVDQAAREKSGGEMMGWLKGRSETELALVRQRAGAELDQILNHTGARRRVLTIAKVWRRFRREILGLIARLLGGGSWKLAVDRGLFRQCGEVHRTMYEDVRLIRLLQEIGFSEVQVVDAWKSLMPGFSRFDLDTVKGEVRKPDSLFVEGRKP